MLKNSFTMIFNRKKSISLQTFPIHLFDISYMISIKVSRLDPYYMVFTLENLFFF